MEENNTTQDLVEDAAPQATETEPATEESTVPNEQTATSEQNGTEETDNTSELVESDDQQSEGVENADSAVFISIPHNHEMRDFARNEAVDLMQRGLYSDPIMKELRYLAAKEGAKSVKEFVENLKTTAENTMRENIRSQLADEGNEELLESIVNLEREKIKNAVGVMTEDENKAFASEYESENERIANEFIALKSEFPEIKEFKDVSKTVLQMAEKNKISLLDAQLRYQHAENKKIKKAEMSAAAAAETSTGSVVSQDSDNSTPALDAMRKGIWG